MELLKRMLREIERFYIGINQHARSSSKTKRESKNNAQILWFLFVPFRSVRFGNSNVVSENGSLIQFISPFKHDELAWIQCTEHIYHILHRYETLYKRILNGHKYTSAYDPFNNIGHEQVPEMNERTNLI